MGQLLTIKKRFLDIVRNTKAEGVILISGDRHFHEISMLNDETVRYPLIAVTSSGLTHSHKNLKWEKNRFRMGHLFKEKGLA